MASLRFGLALAMIAFYRINGEPNPPEWPETVKIFSEDMRAWEIQDAIDEIFMQTKGEANEFSSTRVAFFFKPGTYNVDVPVGYYTSVYGLGSFPDDVVFNGSMGVYSEAAGEGGNALDTFWRSAENFRNEGQDAPSGIGPGMLWAVSQAAPLRRIHATGDLILFQYVCCGENAGYASGGFMANSQIDGATQSGSQQQFFSRNNIVGSWPQGVWNMVFVGTENAPAEQCGMNALDFMDSKSRSSINPNSKIHSKSHAKLKHILAQDGTGFPATVVEATPTIAEKPYITFGDDGLYFLNVPPVKTDAIGPDWLNGDLVDEAVGFDQVYVANNKTDTAATINAKLKQGLHLVLTPGIYSLDSALEISHSGTVVLGLGFATLVSASSDAIIEVGDVDGVRVAGILLQAGPLSDSGELQTVLMRVGTKDGGFAGDSSNPTVLSDVFARVGGPDGLSNNVGVETMVEVNSGHVVGDDFWLWRADHSIDGSVTGGFYPCDHGLIVNGDNVNMYGLAVEHLYKKKLKINSTLQDLTQWYGDNGKTFFYQSELPYDTSEASFGQENYTGYRVDNLVKSHSGYGIGVYSFFAYYHVTIKSGIVAPENVTFHNPLSVFLDGFGTIEHVLNGHGNPTGYTSDQTSFYCD